MKTSEVIAWFIVGAIVILFFIGKKKRMQVETGIRQIFTPSNPAMCSSGGDTICGVGTIAAGVTEPSIPSRVHIMLPPMHPTFCTVCRTPAPVPLKVLQPTQTVITPSTVRLWCSRYGFRKFV